MFSLLAASKGKMFDKNLAPEHYRDRRNLLKVGTAFCRVFLILEVYLFDKILYVTVMTVFFSADSACNF